MSNMRIVYDNLVDRGTVTASSTAGALVASNLQTDTKSDVWRATALAASIYAAWPSSDTVQAIAIIGNFSPTATMRGRVTNETSITNVLKGTENFEQTSTWAPGNNSLVVPYAVTAPDGSLTAAAYTHGTSTGSFAYLCQTQNGYDASLAWVYSLWLKVPSGTAVIRLAIGNVTIAAKTNVADLTVTTTWQRFNFILTAGQLTNTTKIGVGIYGTPGQVYHVWGAQLEQGSAMTSYYPSNDVFLARAAGAATYIGSDGSIQLSSSGAQRISYNPYNLSAPPQPLYEAATTNYVTASGTLTTGWSGGASATPVTGTTYRSLETYQKIAKTVATANEQKAFTGLGAFSAGTTLTLTIAFRAGGQGTGVGVGLYDATTSGTAWGANADSKCVFLEGPGTISSFGGGYFAITDLSSTVDTLVQITRTFTAATTATSILLYPGSAGSTTIGDAVLATRVQVEGRAYPSSYIPTTTSTVTRPADSWTSYVGIRPTGYIDTWQSYAYDSGAQLACPAPALRLRGWTAAQAASAYAYGGGAYARMWLPTPMQATGVAVDIVDANNLQGYIEAARLIVGPYWSPTYNASDAKVTTVDTTELYRTDAGDQGADAGYVYRRVPVDLSLMPAADRAAFVNIARNSRAYPILVSVFPEVADLGLERDHMVYGRRSKDSDVAIEYATFYSTTIEVEEI